MTAHTIEAAGSRFHVEDSGGEGPVVLCLHSLFLDGRMFDDLVEAMGRSWRMVRPDFRGQGRSRNAAADAVGMEQCAGDMAAVADAMGLDRVHVVASSMGGDAAIRLAAYRPDLVASLTLIGTSARPEPPEKVEEFLGFVDDLVTNGFSGERLGFLTQIMMGETTRTSPARKDLVELWTERMAELTADLGPAMRGVVTRGDAVPLLPGIGVPAIVISGEECIVRPPDWAAELADGLPTAELVMVPAVGHSPLLEAPETVTPAVLDFLRRVAG